MSSQRATVGRERTSGLYYEILGAPERLAAPILFIHGGGGSGTTFRATPDGRVGWADLLAQRGYRSWVTDWPGAGRSGYRDLLTLEYADVVDGYLRLLHDVIGEPVVIVPHSMGGAVTWKLVELAPDLVAGVVGIAAAYPANLSRKSQVVSDDGDVVELIFADTGVGFTVDRRTPYTYDDRYVFEQGIARSTRFPMDHVEDLKAGVGAISPRMLLQRVGVIAGMPAIESTAGFAGKRIRLVAGDRDPAHTREIEDRTAEALRSWGADAEVVWLPDRGIEGNAHYLPGELNHEEVLDVVVDELHLVVAGASADELTA
jgi:pimeloyl-ACP methyl ester carboxylesterase